MSMSLRLLAVSAAFAFAGAAFAATPQDSMAAASAAKVRTPQQQRMADCNTQATGKKGDDRKTFMSSCLKGGSATAAAMPTAAAAPSAAKQTQQQKMTSCNASAKTQALAGAARKTFMSSCLKGGAPATP